MLIGNETKHWILNHDVAKINLKTGQQDLIDSVVFTGQRNKVLTFLGVNAGVVSSILWPRTFLRMAAFTLGSGTGSSSPSSSIPKSVTESNVNYRYIHIIKYLWLKILNYTAPVGGTVCAFQHFNSPSNMVLMVTDCLAISTSTSKISPSELCNLIVGIVCGEEHYGHN